MEFEKVRDIIVETLGCDAEQVTLTASLADDLGADSLAAMELMNAKAEKYLLEDLRFCEKRRLQSPPSTE